MSFEIYRKDQGTITTFTHLGQLEEKKVNKFKQPRFKNSKNVAYEQSKSFIFQTVAFCSNITTLLLTIMFVEFSTLLHQEQAWYTVNDLLHLSSISATLFTWLSIYCEVKIDKLADNRFCQRQLNSKDKLGNFVKLIVCFSHPNQYLRQNSAGNEVLAALSYFRILYIYSYLVKMTKYYGTRSNRILCLYGYQQKSTSIKFPLKCLFKEQGLLSNIFMLFFATVVLGLVGMTMKQDGQLLSQVYLCVVSMTTVGYGDESVDQLREKLILIIVIILGSFASSVLTIFFIRHLQLQENQAKAHQLIKGLNLKEKISYAKKMAVFNYLAEQKITPRNKWKFFQRQYENEYDQPRIHQMAINRFNREICAKMKVLVQRQLLTQSLLNFFIERRKKYDENEEKQKMIKPIRRRAEDIRVYHQMKKSILANQ